MEFSPGTEVYIDGKISQEIPALFENDLGMIINKFSISEYLVYLLSFNPIIEYYYYNGFYYDSKNEHNNYSRITAKHKDNVKSFMKKNELLRDIEYEDWRTVILNKDFLKTGDDIDKTLIDMEKKWIENVDIDPYWEEIWH